MANCPNPAGTHLNLCVTLSDVGRHRAALTHAKCAIKLIEYEIKGRSRIDNSPGEVSYGEKVNETYHYPIENPSSPKRSSSMTLIHPHCTQLPITIKHAKRAFGSS